jgi:methionyl-tRNA formyltransferase
VKRYRALFMVSPLPEPAAAMREWLSAGHEIAAIWIPSNFSPGMLRRDARLAHLAPQWSTAAVAGEHNIPVLEVPRLAGWSERIERARAVGADVLVSAYFAFLIPTDFLNLFEDRAVNLHPAPLPRYRGPQPLHAMVMDGSIVSDARVTLHVLGDGFDTGDIIGVCPVEFPDDRSPTRFSLAIARACADLAAIALPAYLDGERSAYPQDEAVAGYCRFERSALAIGPHLKAESVRLMCDMFGLCSISGLDGVRVSGLMGIIGPPLGRTTVVDFWHVEMDLADFRVRLKRKRAWTRPVRNAKKLAIQIIERGANR